MVLALEPITKGAPTKCNSDQGIHYAAHYHKVSTAKTLVILRTSR